jgi:hypothetical protein
MNERESMKERIRRGAGGVRGRFEDVLLGLRELPEGVDRAPFARVLQQAITDASTLADLEVEHARFFPRLDDLLAAARDAQTLLAPLGYGTAATRAMDRLRGVETSLRALREASIDALVAMQDRRLRAPAPADEATPLEPFRASAGVPALHAVLKAPPRVLVDLRPVTGPDEIDDAEDVLDEPEDEPPPLPRTPDEARLVEHARALARDCLSDLANLGGLRVPLPDAPWTQAEPFERRLLANLDALLALAAEPHELPAAFNLFEEVQRYARESPVVDPPREQARALTFASTRGEHALRAVVLTLKQAHPDTFGAYRDALTLARHPSTAPLMRELLLADPDPRRVVVAIEVLRFLREARVADLAAFTAHPDPRVRLTALRAFGVVPERAAAAEVLIDALADEADPRVAAEIAGALVRLGRLEGLLWARARAEEADPAAPGDVRLATLRLLALAGGSEDAPRFLRIFGSSPRDAALAGLFGHPLVVPQLLETLAATNASRRATGPWAHPTEVATALALERITGARLRDAPRELNDYDFARAPTPFAETWSAWWDARRVELDGNAKLRWGEPYSPPQTARELASPGPSELREDLALELAVVAGDVGLEAGDWVARQRAVLVDTERKLAEAPQPKGTFPAAWLRR